MDNGTPSSPECLKTSDPASPLISDAYRLEQRNLHDRCYNYGSASILYAPAVAHYAKQIGATHILDYGCGKERLGYLLEKQGFKVKGYDPALPGLDAKPEPAEFVACLDVLEHIEPERLIPVLKDLHRVTIDYAYLTVCTTEAHKTLSDGTNAHKIILPLERWNDILGEFFIISGWENPQEHHYAALVRKRK